MSMDIHGRHPSGKAGEYLRPSIWYWYALADLCQSLVPDLALPFVSPENADGEGLDEAKSQALAGRLRALIADGSVDAYLRVRNEKLANLPDDPCLPCGGKGVVPDWADNEVVTCGHCDGQGGQRPFDAHCSIEPIDVEHWIAFLEACGGFDIC